MQLCASVHNRLQVVLHENEHCDPLDPEVGELVMEQIRWLGPYHLIIALTVEMPHGVEGGSPSRAL